MNESEILTKVEEIVNNVSSLMGVPEPKCEIILTEEDERVVNVYYSGDNMGYMIGPRGRHLQSLQFILSLMVNKSLDEDKRVSIIVDAGGYTKMRMEKTEQIALKKADDARMLGESIDLEPMSSFDRRVVHTALSKFDDIKTESFGEGNERFVRISLVSDKDLEIGKPKSEDHESDEEGDKDGDSDEE